MKLTARMRCCVRWERLTRATLDHLDFFELVYAPGAQSHPRQYTHPGTEMVVVMLGRLDIRPSLRFFMALFVGLGTVLFYASAIGTTSKPSCKAAAR